MAIDIVPITIEPGVDMEINLQPPDHQSDEHSTESLGPAQDQISEFIRNLNYDATP